MRRVVNGVLYDTEKSDLVYFDVSKTRKYYMTKKRRFFVLFKNGLIEPVTEDFMIDLLGTYDIEKYIEIFGEPEEG